jgi:hypothetical protein
VESLQKAVKDRDATITELKEKNTKQEKKIDEQQRAKAMKEKDAIIGELKQRINKQHQKKDNQTMARLAFADSPVTKSVVDKTLQENNDLQKELEKAHRENKELHLRIEAVLLTVNEEKRLHQEVGKVAERYKQENTRLEREMEATKGEMRKVQLQLIELQESLHIVTALNKHPSHLALSLPLTSSSSSSSTPSTSPSPRAAAAGGAPAVSPRGGAPVSPRGAASSPSPRDAAAPASPRGVEVPSPVRSDSPSPPSHTPPSSSPRPSDTSATPPPADDTTPHHGETEGNGSAAAPTPNHTDATTTPPLEPPNPSLEDDTLTAFTNTLTSSTTTSRSTSFDLGSVDLSDLAKGLDDYTSLQNASSSSELDLMRSLDNMSDPSQPHDFSSLMKQETKGEGLEGAVSPTARLDVQEPFLDPSSAYDHDFMDILFLFFIFLFLFLNFTFLFILFLYTPKPRPPVKVAAFSNRLSSSA